MFIDIITFADFIQNKRQKRNLHDISLLANAWKAYTMNRSTKFNQNKYTITMTKNCDEKTWNLSEMAMRRNGNIDYDVGQ